MKKIAYSKSSLRVLRRMPRTDCDRIRDKIRQHAKDPVALANNVKRLAGSPYIRLRVGDWRIIMDDHGVVLVVLEIGSRGGIYD